MSDALGLIETPGRVGRVAAVDAMRRAAGAATLASTLQTAGGHVTAVVRGDVDGVAAAVSAGAAAARDAGALVASPVIAHPEDALLDAVREAVETRALVLPAVPTPAATAPAPAVNAAARELFESPEANAIKAEIVTVGRKLWQRQ